MEHVLVLREVLRQVLVGDLHGLGRPELISRRFLCGIKNVPCRPFEVIDTLNIMLGL